MCGVLGTGGRGLAWIPLAPWTSVFSAWASVAHLVGSPRAGIVMEKVLEPDYSRLCQPMGRKATTHRQPLTVGAAFGGLPLPSLLLLGSASCSGEWGRGSQIPAFAATASLVEISAH